MKITLANVTKKDAAPAGVPPVDPERDSIVGYFVENQCYRCRWFNASSGTTCEAFPGGIPQVILLGEFDHTISFTPEGDDLLFEPK